MSKQYIRPELEVVVFEAGDIITGSMDGSDEDVRTEEMILDSVRELEDTL